MCIGTLPALRRDSVSQCSWPAVLALRSASVGEWSGELESCCPRIWVTGRIRPYAGEQRDGRGAWLCTERRVFFTKRVRVPMANCSNSPDPFSRRDGATVQHSDDTLFLGSGCCVAAQDFPRNHGQGSFFVSFSMRAARRTARSTSFGAIRPDTSTARYVSLLSSRDKR